LIIFACFLLSLPIPYSGQTSSARAFYLANNAKLTASMQIEFIYTATQGAAIEFIL